MNISDILSEYGAYYEKAGQNKKRVLQLLMQATVTEGHMTPMKTDDTVFKLAQATIDDIIQPFQKGWTPNEAAAFVANELRLYHLKVDEELYPDDIEASWLGFLAANDLDRSKWPLVRYIIEGLYIPKIADNIELKEIFHGEYAEPTPGVAGATGTSMNGLAIMIRDGLEDGSINNIDLGSLTAENIFDKVEEFADNISEVYQGVKMNVFMSQTWYKRYMRDKRAQGFYDYSSDKSITSGIDFTPQSVVALPSMHGSDVIFATPKSNIISLSKKSQNKNKFMIETLKRQVFFMTDFWKGVGFGINGAVWAHDPDASIPE
jgi:hypothetical protein